MPQKNEAEHSTSVPASDLRPSHLGQTTWEHKPPDCEGNCQLVICTKAWLIWKPMEIEQLTSAKSTLLATNIAPEHRWLEDDRFLLGQKAYFQVETVTVSGMQGPYLRPQNVHEFLHGGSCWGIDQPEWSEFATLEEARRFCTVAGYPVTWMQRNSLDIRKTSKKWRFRCFFWNSTYFFVGWWELCDVFVDVVS